MPKLTHKFASSKQMTGQEHNIPGLFVDYDKAIISGYIDAIEAAGVNVDEFKKKYIPANTVWHPKVREYQRTGAEWLIGRMQQHRGAILADDMGLGKTRTALFTAKNLKNDHILICAPAQVANQWVEEAAQLDMKFKILGPKARSKKEWEALAIATAVKDFDGYVVSPNLVGDALSVSRIVPSMLILDEPHLYLRGRTGKWLWDIAEYAKLIDYKLACTGTPMYNTPRDLWSLLFLLFGMRFGKAKVFDARYCDGRQGNYGWINDGASNLDELKQRLWHYQLRRTQEDVKLELPPITTSFRWVNPTKEAQAAMLQSHGSAQAVDGALDKCLNAKVGEVVDTALTLTEPCVIWTYHRHHAEEIAAKVEQGGKQCISIHGGLLTVNRHALIQQAMQNKWSIAATIDSCGTGVNMQGVASTAIFHTIQRIPKKTHQAMKRLHRSGQQNTVHNIFIAMKDAMDEIVVDTVIRKLEYWNSLMGKDDLESNVGEAVKPNQETEDAVLKAIYEEMNDA